MNGGVGPETGLHYMRSREDVERLILDEIRPLMPANASERDEDEMARAVRQGMRDCPRAVEMMRTMSDAQLAAARKDIAGALIEGLRRGLL